MTGENSPPPAHICVHVTTAGSGVPFSAAADHHGVQSTRLHGGEAGPTERLVATRSEFAAGAWVEPGPMRSETLYVLLAGELIMEIPDRAPISLGPGDSAYLPKGTVRSLAAGKSGASMLVVRSS